MDRLVLLNTAILTDFGKYNYQQLTLVKAKEIINTALKENIEILSAIGHQSTADVLSQLFNIPIDVNRIVYKQELSDVVIVFKLNGRLEEGKILSLNDIETIGYRFGLLKKNDL